MSATLRSYSKGLRGTLLDVPMLVKVMGVAFIMAVVLTSVLFWQVLHRWHLDEVGELEENGRFLAKRILLRVEPFMAEGNPEGLRTVLVEMSEAIRGVNAIQLYDDSGQLLEAIGPVNPEAQVSEVTVRAATQLRSFVSVAMDQAHVNDELAWLTRRLAVTIALTLGVGMLVSWWVARLFTRPINELVQKTREVKAGNLTARAEVRNRDEVGELANAFNDMVAEVQKRQAAEDLLLRKLISAEDEERKRVARDLHDHTGQALTALVAGLAALDSSVTTPQQVGHLLAVATQTLSDVHDLSRTLRPVALDELGLDTALKRLCETCSERLGLTVTCATTGLIGNSRLPSPLEVTLYRIIQEAITNSVRHGKSRIVDVVVHRRVSSVVAIIEDDGEGFDAQNWRTSCLQGDHVGLLSMEQRAILLGGCLRIESRAGGGTSVHVEIPLGEGQPDLWGAAAGAMAA